MNIKIDESRFNSKDKIHLLHQSKLTSAINLISVLVSTILKPEQFARIFDEIKILIKIHESAQFYQCNQCNESRKSRVSNKLKESIKHLIIRIHHKNSWNLMSMMNLINLKKIKMQIA